LDTPRQFFLGEQWFGNLTDLGFTLNLLADVVFSIGNFSFLRIIRILQELGTLEAVSKQKHLRLPQLLLKWIAWVAWPVISTIIFLAMVVYLASLCVTMIVQDALLHRDKTASADLVRIYGSLLDTMKAFFMVIVGNARWDELVRPLNDVSVLLGFLFVFFAFFSIGGVYNLLAAILVDEVIQDTRNSERKAHCKALANGQSAVSILRDLLENSKTHTNGQVNRRAAATVLRHDGKHVLREMGLQLPMVMGTLRMLDIEGTGNVNVEELLCTLSQLQAENVSVHLATTIYSMYETKKCMYSIRKVEQLLEGLDISVATATRNI